MTHPVKLHHRPANRWVEHVHPPIFAREPTSTGTERLVAGLPVHQAAAILSELVDLTQRPYTLLHVLHTPRGEADAGRYQSPDLDRAEFRAFMRRYGRYLAADGRHDLWVHSREATPVWARHNLLYAYGPLDRFAEALTARGFGAGRPSLDFEHVHRYRARFDGAAAELLARYDWLRTPLREEDWQ